MFDFIPLPIQKEITLWECSTRLVVNPTMNVAVTEATQKVQRNQRDAKLTTVPPTDGLSFGQNLFWVFSGGMVYLGCQWANLMVLAKMGGPEMVGRFALALAISAPVMMFARLNLRALQATDMMKEYSFGNYLSLSTIIGLLGLFLIAIIACASSYNRNTVLLILTVGTAKLVENISDTIFGLFQKHERMNLIGFSQLTKGPLSILALAMVFYLTTNLIYATVALLIVWTSVLACFDFPKGMQILKETSHSFSLNFSQSTSNECYLTQTNSEFRSLLRMAYFASPLGFAALLASLDVNAPRYFIQYFAGAKGDYELGIFVSMAYLLVIGGRFILVLGQTASPRLARYYFFKDKLNFSKLLLKLVGAGAVVGISCIFVSIALGENILRLLYTTAFSKHINVLIWLMMAGTFAYMTVPIEITIVVTRHLRTHLVLSLISTTMLISFCVILVPSHSLFGAAWAMAITAALRFLFYSTYFVLVLSQETNISFP